VRQDSESTKQILGSHAEFEDPEQPGERIRKTERIGQSQFQNIQDFQFERRNPDLNKYPDSNKLARE